MNTAIRIRQRGRLALPAELRNKYGIKQGDTYYLLDLDGVLVLAPTAPLVPRLAREIERLRQEAGLSTDALLAGLREQRERYVGERRSHEHPRDLGESPPRKGDCFASLAVTLSLRGAAQRRRSNLDYEEAALPFFSSPQSSVTLHLPSLPVRHTPCSML